MKQRYFVVVGIDDEYGWIYEEIEGETEKGTVLLVNPLERYYFPEVFNLSDVIEISEEVYNKILKLRYDSAEDGWSDSDEDQLQKIVNEVIKQNQ